MILDVNPSRIRGPLPTLRQHQPIDFARERFSRRLGETMPDPMDWWLPGEVAIAEEDHIRAMFADPCRAARFDRQQRIVDWVLYLLIAAVLGAAALEWLGVTHWLPGAVG